MNLEVFIKRPVLSYLSFSKHLVNNKNVNTIYFMEQIFLIISVIALSLVVVNYETMNLFISKGVFIVVLAIQLLVMIAEIAEISIAYARGEDKRIVLYLLIYTIVFMLLVYRVVIYA